MVDLAGFQNAHYSPGRPGWVLAAWFFIGAPIVRCSVLPFSSVRVWLLRLFGAEIGEGVVIKPGVRIKYPWLLRVQDHAWLGEDCWIDNLVTVNIGNSACVSQGAYLCTGNHDWSDVHFGLIVKPITLQDGAWVGARAVVAPGITLGECAILTAGSVAKSDVPAYHIYDGNPAKLSRMRRFKNGPASQDSSIPTDLG